MSEKQQIIFMQTRIIRLASESWEKPIEWIVEVFAKYNVLQYIESCYELFRVEGDEAVLNDVEAYLGNKGAGIDERISR